MANLKELRLRIQSVRNTRKITAAMSQIAAARLRRAQDAVNGARPYGDRLREVLEDLVGRLDPADAQHPLLAVRPIQRVSITVMTADRGLCGGFNSNANRAVARAIEEHRRAGREVVLTVVGKKGRTFFEHRRQPLFHTQDATTLDVLVPTAKRLAARTIAMFEPHEPTAELPQIDEAYVVFNYFKSALSQVVTVRRILPVAIEPSTADVRAPEPRLEPNRRELLAHLLPVAIEAEFQQALFNSVASEIAARRMAMNSATDNASQLISDLTLLYNRERQAAITRELMEIIGGAEALKG